MKVTVSAEFLRSLETETDLMFHVLHAIHQHFSLMSDTNISLPDQRLFRLELAE
jgi:hypothetical protein